MEIALSANELNAWSAAALTWVVAFLPQFVAAILILVIGLFLANQLVKLLSGVLSGTGRVDVTVRPVLISAARYAAILFVILIALNQLGVQTTSLIALIGAAGLAVGLALQGTLANIASGLMLLWLRPFSVGDYVEVSNQNIAGTIREIGLFACQIVGADGVRIFAPNATIWTYSVRNYRAPEPRMVSAQVTVPIDRDPAAAAAALRATIQADSTILPTPAPKTFIEGVSGDGAQITLAFWVRPDDVAGVVRRLHPLVAQALSTPGQDPVAFRFNRLQPPTGSLSALQTVLAD